MSAGMGFVLEIVVLIMPGSSPKDRLLDLPVASCASLWSHRDVLALCEAPSVAADVLQLAALLCPPSTVSLASFGGLLSHLPLASLQPPPSSSPSPLPSPSASATPCSLAAAKGITRCQFCTVPASHPCSIMVIREACSCYEFQRGPAHST